MAQIPNLGIHPQVPMTPFGSSFPPQLLHSGPNLPSVQQPFVPKSRRTPSMLGGPPKAPLGGPNRKISPLPLNAAAIALQEKLKTKKVPVKIPCESEREIVDEEVHKKSLWSRHPIPISDMSDCQEIPPPSISTADIFPEESYRLLLPPSVDVFLPGKGAWDEMKQREIDEKLEKLGIEKRTDYSVPDVYGPHGRAASISSPADPALLMYKLNKLRQQQSASNSLSSSPQPVPSSVSPLQVNHVHSMSLASPGFQHPKPGMSSSQGNLEARVSSPIAIFAPQGRVPVQFTVPQVPSRTESRPDFARGFGLDIPEEEEEEEEKAGPANADITAVETQDTEINETSSEAVLSNNVESPDLHEDVPKSSVHGRHASRVSVALSVTSLSKNLDETMVNPSRDVDTEMMGRDIDNQVMESEVNEVLNEWTGSESGEQLSDEESIGEWSNPSDEERARQERIHRRYLRRMHKDSIVEEAPRRIPEFPRPPENRYLPADSDNEDIVSNPSDEGRCVMSVSNLPYPTPLMDVTNRTSRPLPPVPHSRDPSNQYSYYGSLPSHSRGPSDQISIGQPGIPISRPDSTRHTKSSSVSSSVKKELNPFAKPFVFGNRPGFVAAPVAPTSVPASVHSEAASSPAQVSVPSHSRLPSVSAAKVLNAAAQEFKPGGFTFRPPEGVPKLSFPEPLVESRPLPDPPIMGLAHSAQGREKRQRTNYASQSSDIDSDGEDVPNSMSSFRFPAAPEAATSFARSAPTSPNRPASSLNAAAKPFTFSGFSNMPPVLPPLLGQEQRSLVDTINASELLSCNATRGSVLVEDNRSPELTLPSMQKQKRAPIPLDFKHPVSTNMVPAGLFKNLASADADDRARSARVQVGSIEFSDARSDISLDDLAMPSISRTRRMHKPEDLDMTDDEFDRVSEDVVSRGRRTSDATHPGSTVSRLSGPDATSYSKGLHLAERLEGLLEQKMEQLRNDLTLRFGGGGFISESTEEIVKEAMAMFRTQLHDSVARGMENSSMDAGKELDFEMIREIVEQGHEETRRNIQDDLATILKNIKDTEGSAMPESILDLIRTIQDLRDDISASSAHVSQRLDSLENMAPNINGFRQEREALVIDMLAALTPHLAAVRSESIDYDELTNRLSQAVKPHITQLIDLASDKRETAGIITENLMPVLQSIASTPVFDREGLLSDITVIINRIVSPIDTHNIKEQVADLVVERLDSRLATRDNDAIVNFESLKTRITETLAPVIGHVGDLGGCIESIHQGQSGFSEITHEIAGKQSELAKEVSLYAERLDNVTEVMNSIKDVVSQQEQLSKQNSGQLSAIETSLLNIIPWQGLAKEKEEIMEIMQKTLAEFSSIPESISSSLATYEIRQTDILDHLKLVSDASQEFRKLFSQNSELQTQLNKARSQHGQVRVQNDVLSQKLSSVEIERDQLRAKVEELQAASLVHTAEFATLEARNRGQEHAMHTALDRLKISDVNAQAQHERISELEKANRELTREVAELIAKTGKLETQNILAEREKDSLLAEVKRIQEDRDQLANQQSHWDELRQTSEQVESLAKLLMKAQSDEANELRSVKEKNKSLEEELTTLKKRIKEQETKLANTERSSSTARQNLSQAQQRAADWEKKAREFEAEVERLTTALDQGEQTKNQLDADYSLARLQLEERDAEDRIAKDRERKLEEEVASLRTQVKGFKDELAEERKLSRATATSRRWDSPQRRPSSRASTAYDEPEPTTPRINGKSLPLTNRTNTRSPLPTSTWDSMHAPAKVMHKQYSTNSTPRPQLRRPASPALSTVSTVTQDADGWYS